MFGALLDILGTALKSANLAYALQVTNANGFHRLLSLLTHPIREIGEIFSAVLTLKHLWTADVSVCAAYTGALLAQADGEPSDGGLSSRAAGGGWRSRASLDNSCRSG